MYRNILRDGIELRTIEETPETTYFMQSNNCRTTGGLTRIKYDSLASKVSIQHSDPMSAEIAH